MQDLLIRAGIRLDVRRCSRLQNPMVQTLESYQLRRPLPVGKRLEVNRRKPSLKRHLPD